MQAYGRDFAAVYNRRWSGFALQVAPRILEYYESTAADPKDKALLDLCCGAGHLARYFLDNGYRVTGIDLSESMLHYAQQNAGEYLLSGKAGFVQSDASDFTLDDRFGLVVSTYDSVNHLDDQRALQNCFRCVYAVCNDCFIFDLNTRRGLERWNSIQVADNGDEGVIISRGVYDGHGEKALIRFTGFVRQQEDRYTRFDETVFNTPFPLDTVNEILLEGGWSTVHFARINDLATPLAEPEQEGRVFIVARK